MKTILIINAGSSSIKFALYDQEKCNLQYKGSINNLLEDPIFKIQNNKNYVTEEKLQGKGHTNALNKLVEWIKTNNNDVEIISIGHRIVHGGLHYSKPVVLTKKIVTDLEKLIPLAPIHQPYNIEAIKITMSLFPQAKQVGCFDTAFHSTADKLAKLYALPRKYSAEGVMRYGFHGISYEYISSILPDFAGEKANSKVVVAHLGNGSSMCAMHKRKSVATTMGFTALDGLMMGTRAGNIDPGIILYLQQHHNLSVNEVEHLLYKECGLLGVSGISHDIEVLNKSDSPNAKEAIDLFCYRAAQELARMASSLQGLDVLVFTAGIGENSALIRKKICELSTWLGIKIDDTANNSHKSQINLSESTVAVYIIPTNEEIMIARNTF